LPSTATSLGDYALYAAFYNGTNLLNIGLTSVDFSSLTSLTKSYSMAYAFRGCKNLTSVDLSSLTTVSGLSAMNSAFYDCTGLTSINLSSLTTVSGNNALNSAFYGCTSLISVDLSSLTTVSGQNIMGSAFKSCTNLTSVNLSGLETIGANTSSVDCGQFGQFANNSNNLTSLTFPNLTAIYCTGSGTTTNGTFASNNKIQKFYFPKLNTITYGTGASSSNQTACNAIFYGCSALTELHFGAANRAAIQATTGYSTAWGRGAGNVTIYFDL